MPAYKRSLLQQGKENLREFIKNDFYHSDGPIHKVVRDLYEDLTNEQFLGNVYHLIQAAFIKYPNRPVRYIIYNYYRTPYLY